MAYVDGIEMDCPNERLPVPEGTTDTLPRVLGRRVMGPEEIKERERLNKANTASDMRLRVIAAYAKDNGHG